jgi:hypothetical protein
VNEISQDKLSEQVVREALSLVDPATFETVGRAFLQIYHADRYGDLRPHGTLGGSTVPGWPDAIASHDDGTCTCASFTTISSPKDLRPHLERDVKTVQEWMESKHRIRAFAYVAACCELPALEQQDYRRTMRAFGIEHVDLVMVRSLVPELRQANYHTIWPLLGLGDQPALPWRLLQNARIFGSTTTDGTPAVDDHRPTPAEFEQGVVFRSSAFAEVKSMLWSRRVAIVRGDPARGKTTLGADLGFTFLSEDMQHRAYYIDCNLDTQSDTDTRAALAAFRRRDDITSLFIIDNMHRDQRFALRIAEEWSIRGKT